MRKMCRCLCAVLVALFSSCGSLRFAANNPNMIADIAPFSIGSVNVSLEQAFSSKLKEVDVDVVFYPRKNEVALEFRHNLITNRQYWSEAARQQFRAALNSYNEDFDNKRLITDYRKSRASYGKNAIRFEWETFKYSTRYRSSPSIDLGYRFRDNAVYFTVLQRSAQEETSASGRKSDSPQYSIYFTRAQAEDLAKLFDQAYLLESVGSKTPLPPVGSEKDIYIP